MEVAILSEPETKINESPPAPAAEPEKAPAAEPEKEPEVEPEKKKDSKKHQKFSYWEPVAGILFAIIATVIFLGFPQIITVQYVDGSGTIGYRIPTFEAEVIRSLWLPIIIWALLRVGIDVFYLFEKKYTKRLALVSVVGHVLTAICSVIIFISPRIVYWEYVDWVHSYFENVAVWFGNILAKPNLIVLTIMIVVLIIESIIVIRKGNKAIAEKDDEDKNEGANDGENKDKADMSAESTENTTA